MHQLCVHPGKQPVHTGTGGWMAPEDNLQGKEKPKARIDTFEFIEKFLRSDPDMEKYGRLEQKKEWK